ncbi:MAG: pentapeptide repeat-containing protein [Saprospiraceae bacterium]
MTRRLFHLSLLFMSMIMGWTFGFIKVPYVERNDSFWVGFVACLAVMVFIIAIFWAWNNNKAIKFFETANSPEMGTIKQRNSKNKILLSFIIFAVMFFCILSYFNMQRIQDKLNLAEVEINDLKFNSNLEQQRNKITLLLELINKLDTSKVNVQNKLEVDKMIDRIVTLSSSFKIHKEWDMENKVFQSLSTERGLLLLALVRTKMDSNNFKKIKENVSFFGADLRNADLHGLNLSGIDLRNANLQYTNLQGINLNNANVKGANLVGVNLNHASLVGANLIAVKLNWAKINEADLQMVKLDSADLSNATLYKSKLNDASVILAVLCNAIFFEANLTHCNLKSANLANANFTKAILTNTNFKNSILSGAILNYAIIQNNWIVQLIEKNNLADKEILERYKIICDSITTRDSIICRLIPKTL